MQEPYIKQFVFFVLAYFEFMSKTVHETQIKYGIAANDKNAECKNHYPKASSFCFYNIQPLRRLHGLSFSGISFLCSMMVYCSLQKMEDGKASSTDVS